MSIEIRIAGAHELSRLSKALKAAGRKDLQVELRKAIRRGARPAMVATKAAVRAIPVTGSHGGGSKSRVAFHEGRSKAADETKRRAKAIRKSGLRTTIASAISLKVKTGSRRAAVRIEVDEKRLPEDQRALPWGLDSARGWRHPTFGRKPWVQQRGRPWFAVTIGKFAPKIRSDVLKAMNDIVKKIENGA